MMISTKGRYALRIMLDLSQHTDDGYVSLKKISEREDISVKYLEAIVSILNKAGMVESCRGKDGGYKLTKKPEDYTVGSIIKLTEGSVSPVSCLDCGSISCGRSTHCQTLPVWIRLEQIVKDYLDSITLSDLINGKVK